MLPVGIAPLTAREIAQLLPAIPVLKRAMQRRIARDIGWVLKTGTTPPIRKQRARWFREAMERRQRLEAAGRL